MDNSHEIKLEWTGERYVPQIRGSIALEHLHRYAFASEHVNGKEILDIASGEGYGSEMLSRTAKHVYGVDIDEASVKHAQGKYKTHNLEYLLGSCTEIPMPDNSVDVVVSFETIEHITDHDRMMSEVKRVLRPNGTLIISSPNKLAYNKDSDHDNPFHLKELTVEEFQHLLKKYFRSRLFLGQKVIYGSALIKENGEEMLFNTYNFNSLPGTAKASKGLILPEYIISICSDKEIKNISGGFCEQELCLSQAFVEASEFISEKNKEIINLKLNLKNKESSLSWRINSPLRKLRNILAMVIRGMHSK